MNPLVTLALILGGSRANALRLRNPGHAEGLITQGRLAHQSASAVASKDSQDTAPRDGRVQLRVAQPGEVLGGGGRVFNGVDLPDVYMTFFLPETVAGRVAPGSEVRIVLGAAPQFVIPAT